MLHDTIESQVQTVLLCPESVADERSRGEIAAKFHHLTACAFFVKIYGQQQALMMYGVLIFFRMHFLKEVFVQMCTGRARPHGPARASPVHMGLGPYTSRFKLCSLALFILIYFHL